MSRAYRMPCRFIEPTMAFLNKIHWIVALRGNVQLHLQKTQLQEYHTNGGRAVR